MSLTIDLTRRTKWTLGDGWSATNSLYTCDGSQSAVSLLTQSANVIDGMEYNISITLSDVSAGSITPIIGGVRGTAITSATTSNQTITASSTEEISLEAISSSGNC